ncbi:MAG: carboxypeptidase regulatory-like domain-containing protein [Pedosphaera sp.]|nr:carboxypeptidase regulatory-like domain-containing protein [Pedosphaera sp.]
MSEAKGDLRVDAVDGFTYFAEGSPHLAGAAVTVRDSVTQASVATGLTDTNGLFLADHLNEGYYEIEVTADKHTTYRATQLLRAGITNEV